MQGSDSATHKCALQNSSKRNKPKHAGAQVEHTECRQKDLLLAGQLSARVPHPAFANLISVFRG